MSVSGIYVRGVTDQCWTRAWWMGRTCKHGRASSSEETRPTMGTPWPVNQPAMRNNINVDRGVDPVRVEGRWKAVAVCWVLGLGSLMAWNSTLTISDYYYQVFPKYHPSRVLTLMYQPFAVGTMAILAYNESRIDTRRRNIAGYCLFFVSSLLALVLDLATHGKGSIGSYLGLCIVSAAYGVADAHVQGGMVGDLAFMLPEFMQSFFAGLAASGALTSGLRLITKAAFDNTHDGLRKGALLFLAISTSFEFLCIFVYAYYFPKLPIVKYFRQKAASEGSKTVSNDLAAAGIHQARSALLGVDEVKVPDRLTLKQLMVQNVDYIVDLYLIYVLTLSIFPGFLYENTGVHGLGSWYAIVLVAMYNVCDLIARYTPLIDWLRIENRAALMVAVLARFLLIPAFYFTAKYAAQGWMIMLVSFLGLTNGHLTICVMTAAPKGYKVSSVSE
ncbi:Epsin-3, clathrin recruitment and traffic between the Golgi and endosome [Dionaea muscipula]